ncbi:MAG: hypothetical protein ABIQ59_04305 [Nocardioidaceae bacterium]
MGGATVRISNDVFVLLGHPDTPLATDLLIDDLRTLAFRLDADLGEIEPSKRLGDELEILHAVRAVTTGQAVDLVDTLQHILDVAAQTLGCEVGLLRDGAGHLVTTGPPTWTDAVDASASSNLDRLQTLAASSSWCLQDTAGDALGDPFRLELGVCAVLAVALPQPVGGVLVVAHTTAAPRGFTSLCQELGRQVADAGGVVAHTAAMREQLREDAAAHALTAQPVPPAPPGLTRLVVRHPARRARILRGHPATPTD